MSHAQANFAILRVQSLAVRRYCRQTDGLGLGSWVKAWHGQPTRRCRPVGFGVWAGGMLGLDSVCAFQKKLVWAMVKQRMQCLAVVIDASDQRSGGEKVGIH